MRQLHDYQRNFICTVRLEDEKKCWRNRSFQKAFPKFMSQVSQNQFDKVVINFNRKGIMSRSSGSGCPSLSNETCDLITEKLQTPNSSPARGDKSQHT